MVAALLLFYRRRVVNPLAHLNLNLRDLVARKPGARIGYQDDNSEIGRSGALDGDRIASRWTKRSASAGSRRAWPKSPTRCKARSSRTNLDSDCSRNSCRWSGGGCGAFHLLHEADRRFHFTSGYGFERPRDETRVSRAGEGIAGQAAIERKVIVLTDIPADYIRIGSGLGDAPPRVLAAVPITIQDRVLAVVEIASFTRADGSAARVARRGRRHGGAQAGSAAAQPPHARIAGTGPHHRGTHPAHSRIQRRGHLRHGHRGTHHVRESRRLPDARVHRRGTDRAAFPRHLSPSPARRQRVSEGGMPDVSPPTSTARPAASTTNSSGARTAPACRWNMARRRSQGRRRSSARWSASPTSPCASSRRRSCKRRTNSSRSISGRQRAGPDQGRLLARAAGRLRLVQLLRTGGAHFRRPPAPDHRYSLAALDGTRPAGRRGGGQDHGENFGPPWRARSRSMTPLCLQAAGGRARRLDSRLGPCREGRERQAHGHVRRHPGHHRLQTAGDGIGRRQAEGRGSHADEVHVPREHEPRNPHADERHHRPLAPRAQDASSTPKQRDYVSKVHNAGTSLLAIINDILDFSKIEAGKLDLETTDFKLDEVISSVTTLTAQKAHEKGLEFLAHVAPGIPEQSARRPAAPRPDPDQLRQQRRQVHRARRNPARRSNCSNAPAKRCSSSSPCATPASA